MDQPLGNSNSSTYKGSYLFDSVASTAGLPIDQFNFLFSEILALILGIVFRRLLPPKPGNTLSRHLVGMTSLSPMDDFLVLHERCFRQLQTEYLRWSVFF